jgi:Kef-type K+ transport system membrane component KefB
MSDIAVAAVLAGTILLASTVSVEIGLSVALIELLAGAVVGNALSLDVPGWLSFIGSFAGILLTFLVGLLAYYGLGWNHRQAEIAGIALSTTSLAVVYAVLVETGLNQTVVGKRLMAATFVTDFGTAAALSILFVKPTLWIVPFVGVAIVLISGLPRVAPSFFSRYGDRVIEPEIKLVFACLFLLMWLGGRAHSHAVLPAFILGLVMSGHYTQHRKEQERLRVVAFSFLTPFFFLKGGMSVSAGALWANLGILALLFAGKLVPKLAGVYPLARRFTAPHAVFTTLLMSTGLTFGTISSLYGLNAGIIDRRQFSLLIAVVVLSAIVPTVIAQRFFQPRPEHELRRDRAALAAEVA